jgi:hypothetical protein
VVNCSGGPARGRGCSPIDTSEVFAQLGFVGSFNMEMLSYHDG